MKKRFSAFFLALALCLGLAVPAFAADGGTSAQVYTYISAVSGNEFPYVQPEIKYQTRFITGTGKLDEPGEEIKDSLMVVPTSEYFRVGVYNLAENEQAGIVIMAFSDPDGDGIYDQRQFRQQGEDVISGYDVLPIPTDGVYKVANDVVPYAYAIALSGFNKIDDGDYAFSAARLHELFGDNTIIYFYCFPEKNFLDAVLLSAGAFDDVPGLGWYSDPVAWASDKGITTGTGDGIFEPASDCTQSQILTFLWRAEGKPQAAKAPVTVEEWYQDAINWAYEKGMIDNSFDGGEPCTRVTAVSYMWQAKGKPSAAASSFTDMKGYNEDYINAVNWANEKKVTTGVGNNMFDPGSVCNRAQIATFLYRAYNN